jgi:CheY-like chemotaxis protein
VLLELLSNAIKFTPKGGRVQVALQRVDSHVEVCVADNGQGIDPAFLPHVFERFRQADASTTRHHGGLGLGLSIVKSLVELHGGTVRAESAGKGHGATMCIELPLVVVHDPAPGGAAREHPRGGAAGAAAGTAAIDYPSLAGVTVLAVDDEPDARDLLKRVLEECGARVLVAASAQEGLAACGASGRTCSSATSACRARTGTTSSGACGRCRPTRAARTPAAALTAFARAEDRTRALRAGYQTHVAKPVEPTELSAVVASLAMRH